jgi:hypothetical protein
MFYLDSNNNKYYRGQAFNYGDIQYGAGAATDAKFTELGFTQVIPDSRPNDRFYVVSGPDNSGQYTTTPRDLNTLKLEFLLEEKKLARQALSSTDWLVTRNQELGTAIPASYVTYRAAIRTASNSRCTAIAAAADVAALEVLITASPLIEDSGNPGTFIANTSALDSYPDLYDESADIATDYSL